MWSCGLRWSRSIKTTGVVALFLILCLLTLEAQKQIIQEKRLSSKPKIDHSPKASRDLSKRYWELMKLINGSSSSSDGIPSSRLGNRTLLPNLWRPETDFKNGSFLNHPDADRILAQLIWGLEAPKVPFPMKTIYVPDGFSWWGRWKGSQSSHVLSEEDCPGNPNLFRKCTFTEDPSGKDVRDAVVQVRDAFHSEDLSLAPEVIRFYFMIESPLVSAFKLERRNDMMATPYRASDVITPYGKWVYYDLDFKFRNQEIDYSQGKSKMAAIFVSNCHASNNRLGYVKELQKYVEVDVFGACATHKKNMNRCPRSERQQCFDMLKKEYRFYLSFENANCRDYITEKLFANAYENDLIPIVLGAHPDDYKTTLPEKSYLHVEDFPSPQDLAEYMIRLSNDPGMYNSYFHWKGTGQFIDTRFFCRICTMTHYADLVPPPERNKSLPFHWGAHRDTKFNLIFPAMGMGSSGRHEAQGQHLSKKTICLPPNKWYWRPLPKSFRMVGDSKIFI